MKIDQWQMPEPCICKGNVWGARPGHTGWGPRVGNEPTPFPRMGGVSCTEADGGAVSGAQRQTLCPPKYPIHLLIHA